MAPRIVKENGIEFRINLRETENEPPHVHVELGGEEFRINLRNGQFLDEAPKGQSRKVMKLFVEYWEELWNAWKEYHNWR